MSLRADGQRRFLFKLALALGRTVGELEASMSAAEFDEWRAFAALEPFGEWRGDFRAGMIAATIFNVNRGKNVEPASAFDFMPLVDRPAPKLASAEELHARLLTAFPPQPAG